MRVLAPATEDDMVLTFLRAEVDSPRFAGPLLLALGEQDLDRALVDRADRTDPEENAARRRLLATYRGYGRNEALFAGLPDDISWSWVALTPAELADVRYIDWDYWLEVSGGTRQPRDAIARACAPTGTQRAATTAGSLWPPPAGPFPRSSWFSDGRQGRIWCCWKATSD